MTLPTIDLKAATDLELIKLNTAIGAEQRRRTEVSASRAAFLQAASAYLAAGGDPADVQEAITTEDPETTTTDTSPATDTADATTDTTDADTATQDSEPPTA